MNFLSNVSNRFLTTSNSFLLFLVVFTIFIIPFFGVELHQVIYRICFTFIFLLSALALSKYRTGIFNLAVLVILIEWSSEFLRLSIINTVSFIAKIFLFILLIILFINQIVKANKVTPQVIMESINGYLMLGVSFSILTGLVCSIDPTAFSFKYLTEQTAQSVSYVSNYIFHISVIIYIIVLLRSLLLVMEMLYLSLRLQNRFQY